MAAWKSLRTETDRFCNAGRKALMKNRISRRQFFQRTVGAGLVATGTPKILTGLEEVAWADQRDLANEIPRRTLGKTGEQLPMIGIGGGHIGHIQEDADAIRLIHKALDLGVVFVDTAWSYSGGRSEERIGKALKGKRAKVFLMSKVMGRKTGDGQSQLDVSLKRLQTDYLDLWQIHGIGATGPKEDTSRVESKDLSHHNGQAQVGTLLSKRNMGRKTLKAVGRRLSESRMRENLTYGLRWQGMETRTWCG